MKKKGVTLAVGAVLLGCLFGTYALLKSYNETAEKEAEAAENQPVLDIDTEDIKALSFLSGDTQAEFEDTEDGWILKEDETFPVNEGSIESVLSDLASLSAVRTLTDIEDVSEYGFDEPQNTITFADAKGRETKIVIGAANEGTGDDYMMLNEDTSIVYTISSSLRTSISEDLYDYALSESLPVIYNNDVNSVTVEQGDGGYRIYQEEDIWYVENEDGEIAEADGDAIDPAVSTVLNSLNYKDFLEYNCEDGTEYGLDDDAVRLTILYQEETEDTVQKKLAFRIGDKDANEDYYVQMEGSKEVHTLSGAILSELLDVSASDWVKEEETEIESEG